MDEINEKLLALLFVEWRPKLMAIEKAKNIRTITTKEFLRFLMTHEHTLERDRKEKELDKKKR